jgi:putative phage-type endonuclease
MPVINLEQGSKEWLDYRRRKVMATDTPIILGSNRWKTAFELWEEKLELKEPQEINEAMLRGQQLEEEARKLASSLTLIDFRPAVIESIKYPWLAASLDGLGWLNNQYILEIKCPKERTHLEAIDGILPSYHLDQIQHQLLCSQADICYYFSYRPEYKKNPYTIIAIRRDLGKCAEIIFKSEGFYQNMCTMNSPEEWKLAKR